MSNNNATYTAEVFDIFDTGDNNRQLTQVQCLHSD